MKYFLHIEEETSPVDYIHNKVERAAKIKFKISPQIFKSFLISPVLIAFFLE